MNFKKRVNGSWTDTPHYIHKADTDILTTLPDVVYVNDTTATVGLKGNMSQTGTPTPDNPIMPQGTGERTGNLFDFSQISWKNAVKNDVGAETASELSHYTANFTEVKSETTYCLGGNLGTEGQAHRIYFYDENKAWLSRSSSLPYNVSTFTTPINCKYVQFQVQRHISGISWMLVEGSTPLPYEPYGYKIPISSANTTTPVYLGEIQSTRRIKKLVLTGEEDWYDNWRPATGTYASILPSKTGKIYYQAVFCTHIESVSYQQIYGGTVGISIVPGNLYLIAIRVPDTVASNNAEFRAYLAAQYANGTPVTVWYVLATPTTGIVNEPLRKIGDYADTVSGITIPTIAGTNTLAVDTTLQPSEVTVNYHGWHPVQNVHEADNGAWT